MDVLDDDLLRFWKLLHDNKVKYIMIGGFAVNLHGFHRTTNDVDIWIENTIQNRKALGKVLEQFSYTDIDWEKIDLIPGWTNFCIGSDLFLDIIIEMKGLENYTFEDCFQMASEAEIEQIPIPFLHLNHLIQNKKITNRPKDKIDVIELERIQKIRESLNLD